LSELFLVGGVAQAEAGVVGVRHGHVERHPIRRALVAPDLRVARHRRIALMHEGQQARPDAAARGKLQHGVGVVRVRLDKSARTEMEHLSRESVGIFQKYRFLAAAFQPLSARWPIKSSKDAIFA